MSQRALLLLCVMPTLAMSACAGGTDPATNITNVSAQLNARGYSNDGPASWWWEYDNVRSELGTANDTEVCGNPPEADRRCGPAEGGSQSNQIRLGVTVSGLVPDTTYYFRACGRDVNDSGPTCADTKSFRTLAGTAYAFDREWGTRGTLNGQFRHPSDVAIDQNDRVYVADNGNHRVQKFTATGSFMTGWSSGAGGGDFQSLNALTADRHGNVYVTDNHPTRSGDRVQKFSFSGSFIAEWSGFESINDLSTDRAGNVYVADNTRVEKYTSSGAFVAEYGDNFDGRVGVAASLTDYVYVSEVASRQIRKFSPSFALVGSWPTAPPGEGADDLASDSAGNVYTLFTLDGFNNQLRSYSTAGALLAVWDRFGLDNGGPAGGLAVDSRGYVYVADSHNDRVRRFKPTQ